jgi:tetratricopeptide (TPR) repeat protein
MKNIILISIGLFAFTNVKAQDISAKKNTLNKVFVDLVNAYGNAKSPPALKLSPKSSGQKYVATYLATPTPTIVVDEQLFDLCTQMGPDSLNALSIVLSHELAHYYNDHHWCSDFAFALSKEAKSKTEKERNYWHSKEERTIHEGEADNFGLYHSCIAGYRPFNVHSLLLDKIYTAYSLPENMTGYPSKNERKQICFEAQKRISKLYSEFTNGTSSVIDGDYETAIAHFEILTKHFPSRENYNNLGIARAFSALVLRSKEKIEFDNPSFRYPIGIDSVSRLKAYDIRFNTPQYRDINDDKERKMRDLLLLAKKDFEMAINLDPDYDLAYINLACVYDMLGNPDAAIGTVKQLPMNKQHQKNAYTILWISYYHSDNQVKANEMYEKAKSF